MKGDIRIYHKRKRIIKLVGIKQRQLCMTSKKVTEVIKKQGINYIMIYVK